MEPYAQRPVLCFCHPASLHVIVLNNELSDGTTVRQCKHSNTSRWFTAAEIKVNPVRNRKEFCTKYDPLLGYQSVLRKE